MWCYVLKFRLEQICRLFFWEKKNNRSYVILHVIYLSSNSVSFKQFYFMLSDVGDFYYSTYSGKAECCDRLRPCIWRYKPLLFGYNVNYLVTFQLFSFTKKVAVPDCDWTVYRYLNELYTAFCFHYLPTNRCSNS